MFLRGWLAIMPLSGLLGTKTLESHYDLLRALERDKRVKGVLMIVESPGGSATASEMLYELVSAVSAKKPLYAYCPLAASGGYMAALGATRIYAPHTGAVGSIGVLSLKPVFKEFLDKVGMDLEVLKKGRMKDMGLFHRGFTDEERASLDELNEAIYERFVSLTAQRRSIERQKVLELATGALYPAAKAQDLGLIDGVMGFEEVLGGLSGATGVKKERAFFVRPRKPIFRRLLGGLLDLD